MSTELPESFKIVIPQGYMNEVIDKLTSLSYKQIGSCVGSSFIYALYSRTQERLTFFFGADLNDFFCHYLPEITITQLMNARPKYIEMDKGLQELSEYLNSVILRINNIRERIGEKL